MRKNNTANFEKTYESMEKVCGRQHLLLKKRIYVLSKFSGYHDNIEFKYKIENDGKLPFLDVLVIHKDDEV